MPAALGPRGARGGRRARSATRSGRVRRRGMSVAIRRLALDDDAGIEAYLRIRNASQPDNPDSREHLALGARDVPGRDGPTCSRRTPDGTVDRRGERAAGSTCSRRVRAIVARRLGRRRSAPQGVGNRAARRGRRGGREPARPGSRSSCPRRTRRGTRSSPRTASSRSSGRRPSPSTSPGVDGAGGRSAPRDRGSPPSPSGRTCCRASTGSPSRRTRTSPPRRAAGRGHVRGVRRPRRRPAGDPRDGVDVASTRRRARSSGSRR